MKGVIPGVNVKVFGRSVHSLSRIGEELYFEPLEHGLALRTVNSSRSAYGCFLFAPSFFLHYDDGSGHINSADAAENLVRCKIAMKPCLGVFKSLSLLDKSVERCIVSLNMDKARLTFQLHCRHGIVKTYNLAFIECETLQAVFSKDLCPNSLLAQSRLLCDVVANFQTTQEEISFIVSPDHVCIKNYIEDEIDPSKVIRTELMVSSDEFDRYTAARDTEITFCLKELRAILAFTDSINLPVSIHFESPGKYVFKYSMYLSFFCVDSDPTFEGNFVLATLADDITSGPSGSQQQQQQQQQQQRCGVSTASTSNVKNKRPAEAAKTRLESPAAGDAANLVLDR
ncbi:Cell cycle checkpoint control protein RAD9A [Lamellibrachia satsuma]|nr:Cell cycle checkpoint control protein RAD9A [Lamellibrachia satsuma]